MDPPSSLAADNANSPVALHCQYAVSRRNELTWCDIFWSGVTVVRRSHEQFNLPGGVIFLLLE